MGFRIYGIFGTVWVWYTSLPRGHWTTIMNAWYYRYRLLALLYLHTVSYTHLTLPTIYSV